MLIFLLLSHNVDGKEYPAGSVVNVPSEVSTWLTGISKARAVTSGPADWSATAFALGALVKHSGTHWVANAITTSADVPGVSNKWDAASYLIPAAISKTFNLLNTEGELYVKDDTGTMRRVVPAIVGDAVTLAVED